MRLWTRQSLASWNQLQLRGTYRTDGRRIWRSFKPYYRWLVGEMRTMIGPPPKGVTYPVWAWHTWDGIRSGTRYDGDNAVALIRINIPDDQVVLSDFDLWHVPLNDLYLGMTQRESNDFWRKVGRLSVPRDELLAGPFSDELRESWKRMFDVRRRTAFGGGGRRVQATFWELRLEHVERVWFSRKRT